MTNRSEPVVAPVTHVEAVKTYSGCDWVNVYSDWNTRTMRAICMAESGGNVNAINRANRNGTTDRGLFQVNSVHADMVGGDLTKLYDARTNVEVAHKLWLAHSYRPWSSFNSGAYLRHFN